ncbi:MAG: Zinc transporter, family [Thermoleophilia bacterium]|nr:Zinc transporter, family [Thermoleophilia bacterium]
MLVLLLALCAAIGFGAATLFVETSLGTSRAFHHVSVVVAAGILLGVAIADLLPEAFELAGHTRAALAIAVGFLVLFLIEALTGGHTHHHEPHVHGGEAHAHAHAHAHGDVAADDPCIPVHAVLPFLIGLALHNFTDGVVIGASHEVSDTAAAGVAGGIVLHQLPVGLSFAAVLLASGIGVRRMRRNALFVALLIPVGALTVLAAPHPSGTQLGSLIGVAAGAIIYIATGHLLPEAHSEERRPGVAIAFAAALLGSVLFTTSLH